MDPEFQTLGLQLAEAAARNTAGVVADRIGGSRAKKKDQETIAELEEIINSLLVDKNELVRIAQAYEDELVAQRISPEDIRFMEERFVPLLIELMATSSSDEAALLSMMQVIKPLLSTETVSVLQMVGFNFKRAIGEPLTELVAGLITKRQGPVSGPAPGGKPRRG